MASAGFVTFDAPELDFPGNRSPPRWKFVYRPKRKICAPGEVRVPEVSASAKFKSSRFS
jgi:hypothetical protein